MKSQMRNGYVLKASDTGNPFNVVIGKVVEPPNEDLGDITMCIGGH